MTKYSPKNQPKMKLETLLNRRKMTLEGFCSDVGVSTFESLKNHCERLGVQCPEVELTQFKLSPPDVNDPSAGVVVLEVPAVIEEKTGEKFVEKHVVQKVSLKSLKIQKALDKSDNNKSDNH